MDTVDIFGHFVNFVLPAAGLAALMGLCETLIRPRGVAPLLASWWLRQFVLFVIGALALSGSMLGFGVDAKMAGYVALVLLVATAQWVLLRGWGK